MKIAILGWGSLIWDPRNLEIDKKQGQNGWLPDGPTLPIEFSRISQDGRLTLVIDNEGNDVQTLYAISNYTELDHAILDLAVREGCGKSAIGYFSKNDNKLFPSGFSYKQNLSSWIHSKENIDSVIWTNLKSKLCYQEKNGRKIEIQKNELIDYLTNLSPIQQAKAEEYIRKAPSCVGTLIRSEAENKLKWTKIN